MAIITISRGSYSKGKEVAEQLADKLGYKCISREVLLEASGHYNVPEVKLVRAIHDAPSFFDRFTYGKEKYIAFITDIFFEYIQKDNIVYHGLAGHFLAKDLPNVLKVRIIANLEDRVKEEMKRENISEKEARYRLTKDDQERRKWSMYLYGIDTQDPSLYDIVLHIDQFNVNDAVDILYHAVQKPCFQMNSDAKRTVEDLRLAASAKAALVEKFPTAATKSRNGVLVVTVPGDISHEEEVRKSVEGLLRPISGIKKIDLHIIPIETYD
jgi:hypothetical protein